MISVRLVAAALAAAAPLSLVPALANPSAAKADWARTVAVTPEGGYRLGNPNAPVKLVEYGSLTCPHCRDFAKSAMGPLSAYIKSGKVSFEYRNFILNGIDVTAALVARCGSPSRFFPMVDELYATQSTWVSKISDLPEAEKEKLRALPVGQRLGRLAEIGGILALASRHGVPAAKAKACLADGAALDRLGQMAESAEQLGVKGTPTFFINGTAAGAADWASLERLIKDAGA